ncbi:FAD-binding oxidoreductase [Amaricoccus sp.]|uniref:NAD(P)/FAD-dependent oxidoreductase n=1 Tax=Amaricoccus sp. TaxID=1872485 RepID=UPI001B5831D7|nr:FAD-binding oxidoreductase [Amaricoccus sp.]MBP7001079.1 FAD-binding oxidoreductase [Amaricoccus sp.]
MAAAPSYAGDGAHAPSYYAASANPAPDRPPLRGDLETDVCVLGAGYTGLSTALHLAEKGYRVAVVEGARVGWGASGRNGGQIVNGFNASLQTIERRYGRDAASFVAGMVQEGGEIIRARVRDYDIRCDLKNDNVFVALTEAHLRGLRERIAVWESFGLRNQELLDRARLRDYVRSDLYVGGAVDHTGGHIHPLNLALGEAAALERNGGVIYEHSPVIAADVAAPRPVLRTAQGSIASRILVLAGNAYLGAVVPALAPRVMPVSTQIMATKPLGEELAQSLLPGDACVEDVRWILDYYRLSADKRLLFGGGTVYGGTDPKDIVAKLRPNLDKVFPQLRGVQIDYAWSGNFALSYTRVPQIGRLNANVYFGHGDSGHGVTGTHAFGRILAEAIDGDTSRFDVFAAMPWVPFPGGQALRVPYSVMGSWWYGLRDRLGV